MLLYVLQVIAEQIHPCDRLAEVIIPAGTPRGLHKLALALSNGASVPWRSTGWSGVPLNVLSDAGSAPAAAAAHAGSALLIAAAAQLPGAPRRPGSVFSLPVIFTGFDLGCASLTLDGLASLKAALQRDLAAGLRSFGVANDDVGIEWLRSGPLQAGNFAPDSIFSVSVLVAASASRIVAETRSVAQQAVTILTSALRSQHDPSMPHALAGTMQVASALMGGAPVTVRADVTQSCRSDAQGSGSISGGCTAWVAADGKVRCLVAESGVCSAA